MKINKIKFIAITMILISVVFGFLFINQSKAVETEKEKFNYHLMVPLPTASGTVTEVEGITDYIKTIYLFAMGIAGVLAMALIVVGGFQWLTATGNTSTISQAKARINNALLGLVVLLSAYLLLNTINPALVNLKEPVLLFLDWTEEFGNAAGGGPGGPTTPDCPGGRPSFCCDSDGNIIVTTCFEYEITRPFGAPIACESDPCGASDAPCSSNDAGVHCFSLCPGVSDCTYYDSQDECVQDICHKGPCEWIGGLPSGLSSFCQHS